ncbi:MAG TPA: plastocyanin/azurin family copper-binding protein [Symbiobacteriaceae bacterium]|nr:plastocyanin/azurin family copper-binding protein [Symbiobacteriaceae bacterium]
MTKRIALAAVAVGLVLALVGCGGGPAPTASAPADGKEVLVHMVTLKFDPETLSVPAGTTVRWVNDDGTPHSVFEGVPDSGKYLFRSANLSTGKSFAYKFEKPGTYEIFCNTGGHHFAGMKMRVVVN